MKTRRTYMQVIDLLLSDLSPDTLSLAAERQITSICHSHFELNFFTI